MKYSVVNILTCLFAVCAASCSGGGHKPEQDAGPDAGDDAGPDGGSGVVPRLIAPLSTSMVRSNRPTFRWTGGEDVFLLEIAADRDFEDIEYTWEGTGFEHAPDIDLPKGPHFWRVSAPANEPEARTSRVWEVFAGTVPYDVNGDGYSDIMITADWNEWFYLFYGGPDFAGDFVTDDADVLIVPGVNAFGNACSIYSDMSGDGIADIVFNGAMGNMGLFICEGGSLSSQVEYGDCHNLADDVEVQGDYFGGVFFNNGDIDLDGSYDLVTMADVDVIDVSEGTLYLYLSAGGDVVDIEDREDYDFAFVGQEAYEHVMPLDMASDLDGDGFSELFVSTSSGKGRAWIVLGSDELEGEIGEESADVTFVAVEDEREWFRNSDADDVDRDGYGDMWIHHRRDGTWGQNYIGLIHGAPLLPETLDMDDFSVRIAHPGQTSIYKSNLDLFSGDFNGDGVPDVGITHFGNMGPAWEPEVDPLGAVYIFYGGDGLAGDLTVEDADVTILGNGDPWFAQYASDVGDVNGDGYDDFAVSATGDVLGNTGDMFPGRVFVFFGGPALEDKVTADDADVIISAEMTNQVLGMCINRGGV